MAEPITGTFETKQIHELVALNKLTGKEEVLIDNGDVTLRVTVDTLLGYIRDQINASINGAGDGTTIPGGDSKGSTIHIIEEGEDDIPIESRLEGHYYIRVQKAINVQTSSGLPRLIRVSPNMQLRMITE